MGFELTTLVVIGTDRIGTGSCKSNYHTITTPHWSIIAGLHILVIFSCYLLIMIFLHWKKINFKTWAVVRALIFENLTGVWINILIHWWQKEDLFPQWPKTPKLPWRFKNRIQKFRTGMEKIRKIWIYEVKGFNWVFKRWYIGML